MASNILALIDDLYGQLVAVVEQRDALAAKNAELHADIEVLQAQAADCLMVHE